MTTLFAAPPLEMILLFGKLVAAQFTGEVVMVEPWRLRATPPGEPSRGHAATMGCQAAERLVALMDLFAGASCTKHMPGNGVRINGLFPRDWLNKVHEGRAFDTPVEVRVAPRLDP